MSLCVCQSAPVRALVVPVCCERGLYLKNSTTKKVAGGVVSTYMHETLQVGDTVKLTPPYGVFTLDQELPTGVLVSAGIGVTPMINFARALGDKTALVVHVDKTEAAHAFKAEFESYKTLFKYTDGGTRPSVASVAKETIEAAGTGHCFYICGPPAWMKEMQAELLTLGAKKVMCEVFGSQLATGCPFAASAPEADFDDRTADYAGEKRYSADGGTDENDDGVVGEAPPNATPLTVAEMRKENNLSDLFK